VVYVNNLCLPCVSLEVHDPWGATTSTVEIHDGHCGNKVDGLFGL